MEELEPNLSAPVYFIHPKILREGFWVYIRSTSPKYLRKAPLTLTLMCVVTMTGFPSEDEGYAVALSPYAAHEYDPIDIDHINEVKRISDYDLFYRVEMFRPYPIQELIEILT